MYGWTVEEVKQLIIEELRKIQELQTRKDPRKYTTWLEDSVYEVPTKHGVHLITPPFNLESAQKVCPMIFEGARKGNTLEVILSNLILTDVKIEITNLFNNHKLNPFNIAEYIVNSYFDNSSTIKYALQDKLVNIPGWLHKDGMTLLYMECSDNE